MLQAYDWHKAIISFQTEGLMIPMEAPLAFRQMVEAVVTEEA